VIEGLPKSVPPTEVAPLLDSAKDQQTGQAPAAQPGAQAAAPAAPTVPPPPPPTNDRAAQAGIRPARIVPIDQQKGQPLAPAAGNAANAAPAIAVPQGARVVSSGRPGRPGAPPAPGAVPGAPGANGNAMAPAAPGRNPPQGRPGAPPNAQANAGPPQPGAAASPPNPLGLGIGVVLQLGNQLIVNSPGQDQQRIASDPQDRTSYEQLPGNRYRETITRPDGVRVVTVFNRNGDILQRSRFDRNGRETVLAYFDDSHDDELLNWRDPGADLPPLRLSIPARDYVLDAGNADERQVQDFFAQPPVEKVQRLYSIDEVKRSARLRDSVRRLEVGGLTFDTGAATISQDQIGSLDNVAQAMLALLDRNPAETFLIEGHTDAVGSDIANLQLSDARAATVARILTDFYHVPPENLATQGYGERFLKVQTDGPERINRRVTIRRITPLVTVASQN
jgi:outer membrane protein OmpA-like peptidoglycan-associated protein